MMDIDLATLGSLTGVITAIGGAVTYWIRSEIKSDGKERAANAQSILDNQTQIKDSVKNLGDAHEKRLDRLEIKVADFMPRSEILDKIAHESGGRRTLDQTSSIRHREYTAEFTDIHVKIGKLENDHAHFSSDLHEIKDLMKDQRKENNERLDKIAEQIAGLSGYSQPRLPAPR